MMSMKRKGFTLIELLIVIGILGILAAVVLVAVDPAKRLKQARDARRFAEVNSILNAILNYTVDKKGTLPSTIDNIATSSQMIGTGNGSICDVNVDDSCYLELGYNALVTGCVNLTNDLVEEYLAEIPIDSKGNDDESSTTTYDATRTGYYVNKTAAGRIEVGSCVNEDNATTIKAKR
jgi:prepilin-type N-terminal cleavage/methylation domain-containing protein